MQEQRLPAQSVDAAALTARGSVRWPSIALHSDAVAAWIARRDGAPILFAEDAYLVVGCLHGDPSGLRALEAIIDDVESALVRVCPADLRGDVMQELRIRLLVAPRAKLEAYRGIGPLPAWIRTMAIRLALDAQRKSASAPAPVNVLEEWSDTDPELALLWRKFGPTFVDCLREAMGEQNERDVRILTLYHQDGLTRQAIAEIFQVDRSTVNRWIASAHARIRRSIEIKLAQRIGLHQREISTLMRAMRASIRSWGLDT